MTFLDLQNQVAYILDDLNFGYFTQTQVQFWINNAHREVQKKLLQSPGNWYVQMYQTLTVANQNFYASPSDFLKLNRMELVTAGTPPNETKVPLEPMTINDQDKLPPGVGTPCSHYMIQNIFGLYPAPDTAGQILRIFYTPLVQNMVSPTDVPNCPTQYQELIGLLAAKDGFVKDQRDPATLNEKIAYYDVLMKQDAEQRSVERGRVINVTQGQAILSVY